MTVGGRPVKASLESAAPMISVSSSWTIFTTSWPGVRLFVTSWPRARSFTAAVNSLTTARLTSASSSARRISRMAFEIVSSSSFPRERRPPRTACSLSPRASNIAGQCTDAAVGATDARTAGPPHPPPPPPPPPAPPPPPPPRPAPPAAPRPARRPAPRQAAGGVDQDDVAAPALGCVDRVVGDGCRVAASRRADEVRAGTPGPDLELLLGGGAERVGSGDEDRAVVLAQAVRQLTDGRGLA